VFTESAIRLFNNFYKNTELTCSTWTCDSVVKYLSGHWERL